MVIITGAASGIGAACATRFLHEGFRVCTTDNDKTPLDLITDRLNKEGYQSNLLPINMDVCSREEIEQTSQTILNKWKSIDILINCAGIFASKPFNETEADLFKKIMDVNLFGTFNVCQIISQIMKDNGGGKIINLSSISALQGALNASAYAASKAGVIALSKTMARELAQNNIQVNIVTPGFIDTPMAEPYIKMYWGNEIRVRGIISLSIIVWNMSFLPQKEQSELQEKWLEDFLPKDSDAQDVATMIRVFENLEERQRDLFPNIRTFIMGHDLRLDSENIHLDISSVPLGKKR